MQQAQRAVLGPKIMAPLAHAVRLVNRKQAQQPALVQAAEQALHARRVDAFRRGVQQRQLVFEQLLFQRTAFFVRLGRVQKRRRHACLVQRAHLVVHQRNQRRDHDSHAVARVLPHDRRYLVAQRLAPAGGHQHQRVAASDHVINDGLLRAAKAVVTKDRAQDILWRGN